MSIDHEVASAVTRIAAAFEQLVEVADRYSRVQADNQSEMLRALHAMEKRNQQDAVDLPKDAK